MAPDDQRLWPHQAPGLWENLEKGLLKSWRGRRPWPGLRPFGALYSLAARLRPRLYGPLFKVARADRPVISLGNLTVGGSGKTPMALALAGLLLDQGFSPAVLSRGYGRRAASPEPAVVSRGRGPELSPEESGDEPWLMADQLAGLIVVVAARRARAAETAVKLGADLLIMDDGYQHLGLAADCRLLLLPGREPFGNGAVLPAGPLREPLSAHRRADILISTGAESPAPEALALAGGRPVFAAEYQAAGWRDFQTGAVHPPEHLAGRRAFAFCGLGRPDNFQRSLLKTGLELSGFAALRDHQTYDQAALDGLGLAFMASRAELMVTTAKDAVKLPADFSLPLMILQMEMDIKRADEFAAATLTLARQNFEKRKSG